MHWSTPSGVEVVSIVHRFLSRDRNDTPPHCKRYRQISSIVKIPTVLPPRSEADTKRRRLSPKNYHTCKRIPPSKCAHVPSTHVPINACVVFVDSYSIQIQNAAQYNRNSVQKNCYRHTKRRTETRNVISVVIMQS